MMNLGLIPPSLQRNGEGTVFTGLCLFTFHHPADAGYPIWLTGECPGVPPIETGWSTPLETRWGIAISGLEAVPLVGTG